MNWHNSLCLVWAVWLFPAHFICQWWVSTDFHQILFPHAPRCYCSCCSQRCFTHTVNKDSSKYASRTSNKKKWKCNLAAKCVRVLFFLKQWPTITSPKIKRQKESFINHCNKLGKYCCGTIGFANSLYFSPHTSQSLSWHAEVLSF